MWYQISSFESLQRQEFSLFLAMKPTWRICINHYQPSLQESKILYTDVCAVFVLLGRKTMMIIYYMMMIN